MFDYIYLNTNEISSTDTELRFLIASALVEGKELIALAFAIEDDIVAKKFFQKVKRVLSVLKREGKINFYIEYSSINGDSTEAEFLKNKYLPFLAKKAEPDTVLFVKI